MLPDQVKRHPKPEFDVCIIDEAGQLVEAETAIVLQVGRLQG